MSTLTEIDRVIKGFYCILTHVLLVLSLNSACSREINVCMLNYMDFEL